MLRNDLLNEEWNEVYTEGVNDAYDSFFKCFITHYDKHCPIIQLKQKGSNNKKTWITKGLQNACKKKNTLYRDFIKFRTNNAENKYKRYKNKLTTIMRQAKREYYNKILKENEDNLKGTWRILNEVMRNKTAPTAMPNYFINYNREIKDMNQVAINRQ